MTAKEIINHDQYLDGSFLFPNEKWNKFKYLNCTRYAMSNCYRVKNTETGRILKPCTKGKFRGLSLTLYGDDRKANSILMSKLWDDFDYTEKYTEYIYGAY